MRGRAFAVTHESSLSLRKPRCFPQIFLTLPDQANRLLAPWKANPHEEKKTNLSINFTRRSIIACISVLACAVLVPIAMRAAITPGVREFPGYYGTNLAGVHIPGIVSENYPGEAGASTVMLLSKHTRNLTWTLPQASPDPTTNVSFTIWVRSDQPIVAQIFWVAVPSRMNATRCRSSLRLVARSEDIVKMRSVHLREQMG